MKRIASILILGLLLAACSSRPPLFKTEQEHSKATEVVTKGESSLRLVAAGDILIHDVIYNDARLAGNRFDFRPMLAPLKPYIEEADFALANQESIIGGVDIGLSTYPSFNSPIEVADALAFAGFDIVSLANNHVLDRGEQALQRSLAYWDQLGIIRTGAYSSEEDQQNIRTFSKNGITCSILSYTYGLNGIDKLPKPHLVNLIQTEQMKHDVERAKQLSDVVIVNLHFGNEYETMPNNSQKELVQLLADLGVSIIFGHHPHVLQPPAIVKGARGNKTFTAYSLGNLFAGQANEETHFGGLMAITIKKEQDGRILLEDPSFLPTFTYSRDQAHYQVMPLVQVTKEQYPKAQERYAAIVQHMRTFLPTLRILEAK